MKVPSNIELRQSLGISSPAVSGDSLQSIVRVGVKPSRDDVLASSFYTTRLTVLILYIMIKLVYFKDFTLRRIAG